MRGAGAGGISPQLLGGVQRKGETLSAHPRSAQEAVSYTHLQQPHGHSQRHRPVRPDQNGSRQRGKQDRSVNESDLYCTYLLSKNVIKKETGHSYKNVLFLLGGDGGI